MRKADARLFVGLMSGTSVDAIDAALVRIRRSASQKYSLEVLNHVEWPWPDDIRSRLLAVMAPASTTTLEICELNIAVAEHFAFAAFEVVGASNLRQKGIAGIGSHGQTVCHLPRGRIPKHTYPSTLQLGDVSAIATLAGVPVVGNFRSADMTVGGQGAPLVPWVDQALLSDDRMSRCVQNIGGIGNVTFLAAKKTKVRQRQEVIAFDTGPGNMVMDAIISYASAGKRRFDRGGRIAKSGSLKLALLKELQSHPYFDRSPPKSTGREEFGAAFAAQIIKRHKRMPVEDLVHTVTRLTAWSIADAYAKFLPELPDEVIVCGGGADNPVLMKMLEQELQQLSSNHANMPPPRIRRIDEFNIPNKAKEAASFALLAAATLDGLPANLPSVTGARSPVILGVVSRPYIHPVKK